MKIIRILFFGILLVALVGLACSSGGGGGDDDDDSEESAESCVSGLSPVYSCESGEVGDLTPSQVDANTLCQDGEPRYTCAAQCGRTASTCAQVISCTQACFTPDFATSNFERCQEQAAELFGPSGCFQAAVYQRNLENSCILLGDVSEAEQQAYLRCLDRVINECGSYVEPEDAFTNGAGACVTEYLFVDSDDDDDDDDDDIDDDDDDDDNTTLDCEKGVTNLYDCEFVMTDESGDLSLNTAINLCEDGNEDAECYATCAELYGADCDGMEDCIVDSCLARKGQKI